MKKVTKFPLLLVAILTTLCTGKAFSQEPAQYQSKQTGISVIVPNNMEVVKDDENILHLQSPDVTFSVHPLMTENLTQEAMIDVMTKTAQAVGIDFSKMATQELQTKTLAGVFYSGNDGKGVVLVLGVMSIPGNESVVLYFTLTYNQASQEAAEMILSNFEFDASAIE